MQNHQSAPTAETERLLSLDVLRGFAVLGILIMNIQLFSMIEAAYFNPTAYGDLSGLNELVWISSHIFADQKFMAIFSVLFGGGIILVTRKLESRGNSAAGLYYRRLFILLLIGIIHAYGLWHGDILVIYALCAFVLYFARKKSAKTLLTMGLVFLGLGSAFFVMFGYMLSVSDDMYQSTLANWQPSADAIARELSSYRGNWTEQMAYRVPQSLTFQIPSFLAWGLWRTSGLMLIGMALYKMDVLSAALPKRTYVKMILIGFGVGLPLIGAGIVTNFNANWSVSYSMFYGWQFNHWGSLFISGAYLGAIMLLCQSTMLPKVKAALAAVGRTALSNYLLQTLICTTLFYGHGFGLIGTLERVQQVAIVLAIWLLQMIVSLLWLKHFRFGPAEWLWRSLTYLKLQPFRN